MAQSTYIVGRDPTGKILDARLDANGFLIVAGGGGGAGGAGAATPMPVGANEGRVSAEVSRPAGTLTYTTPGVAVATLATIPGCARVVGGSGDVVLVRLSTQNPVVGVFRVYLFNAAPTAAADNAAFNLMYADLGSPGKLVGMTDISVAPEGAGSDAAWGFDPFVRWPFVCGGSVDALYAQIVNRNTSYAALATQKFTVGLGVVRN